ncbi:lysozyme [Modicisalibacter muralis]|uniref:Lysozyme n=1 Tax=Modicisalibacter muralis TaxID=119000 RepID=A0A1G9MV06_9GAMM|nr:lysozyme [Halomonas muralis]SDL78068.1 lysozyme [Halomonas muralis]
MSLIKRLGIPVIGGALTIAAATVSHFEGRSNEAYLDPVGIPTICDGHTQGVQLGQTLSNDECDKLLAGDLGDAFDAVDQHVDVVLPPTRRAALASFTYNVGEDALMRSTLLRKLNAGDVVGACNELRRWVYAGGRKLAGLVRRRKAERELCLIGTEQGTLIAGQPAGGGS